MRRALIAFSCLLAALVIAATLPGGVSAFPSISRRHLAASVGGDNGDRSKPLAASTLSSPITFGVATGTEPDGGVGGEGLSPKPVSSTIKEAGNTVEFNLWEEFRLTIGMVEETELHLSAVHIDTADRYLYVLTADNITSVISSLTYLPSTYDFLVEALSVAQPASSKAAATQVSGGSISCQVWLAELGDSTDRAINIRAKLKPDFAFLSIVEVELELPLEREGTDDEKNARMMAVLTQQHEEAVEQQRVLFTKALEVMHVKLDQTAAQLATLALQQGGRIFVRGFALPTQVEYVIACAISTWKTYYTSYYYYSTSNNYGKVTSKNYVLSSSHTRLPTEATSQFLKLESNFDKTGLLPYDVTSDEMMALTLCPEIRILDLHYANVTHLDFLASLSKLEHLSLEDSTHITSLEPLRHLTSLKTLTLYGCSGIQDVGVLNSLPTLELVDLTGTGVLNKQTLTNPQLTITGP